MPLLQLEPQTPAEQTSSGPHFWPHSPQLAGSLCVSWQRRSLHTVPLFGQLGSGLWQPTSAIAIVNAARMPPG